MWKAAAGHQINISDVNAEDDEWETDPDFVNDVDEQQQRWGSATVQGSGRTAGAIDMNKLRRETEEADSNKKKKEFEEGEHNPSYGYGGKFGIEKDRMDQSAVGHEYVGKVEKHASQKDYSKGFGGKFGIETDRIDKSALNWDHKEKLKKHASQKDYVTGFGGKFGLQTDRQDKSALGWDHVENIEKHESQKDYKTGFGGKFGIQTDRQDKSAVGWDHHEAPKKHESQINNKIGLDDCKFGSQTDKVDKSKIGTNYTKVKPDIGGAKPSDLRAKFETMSQTKSEAPMPSLAPRKNVHAKAALFSNTNKETPEAVTKKAPTLRPLDDSKTAFLTQSNEEEITVTKPVMKLDPSKSVFLTQPKEEPPEITEGKIPELNQSKLAQPTQKLAQPTQSNIVSDEIEDKKQQNMIQEEMELLRQLQQQRQGDEDDSDEQIYENYDTSTIKRAGGPHIEQQISNDSVKNDVVEETDEYSQEEIVDTGIAATALYDYQAAADDEISFDPDDVITHIDKIDAGWWRGLCKGKYGLFPANYVQCEE